MPPAVTKSKLAIFWNKGQGHWPGAIWKGFISWVCEPNMKSLSFTVHKLWPRLKVFATDRHMDTHTDWTKTRYPRHAWFHLHCIHRALRKGNQEKNSKSRIEQATSHFSSCHLRPLGHADSWQAVVSTLTLSWHMNIINSYGNTWLYQIDYG